MTHLKGYKGCAKTDCGMRIHSSVHSKNSPSFDHKYVYQEGHEKQERLCASCAAGEHKGAKTRRFGCIEHVTPESFVCGCSACRHAAIESERIASHRRGDSEGVSFIDF